MLHDGPLCSADGLPHAEPNFWLAASLRNRHGGHFSRYLVNQTCRSSRQKSRDAKGAEERRYIERRYITTPVPMVTSAPSMFARHSMDSATLTQVLCQRG